MIIEIPVEFDDDFYPPKQFDGVERDGATGFCQGCTFYFHDSYEDYEECALGADYGDACPIRQYFQKII